MVVTFNKIKIYAGRAAVIAGLSLIVFFGVFYLVNLDFSPAKKASPEASSIQTINLDEEFAKRLGSVSFGTESYGNWAKRYKLNNSNNGLDADPDSDELPNYLEYIHGTNPLQADSDGDKFSDRQEILNGYDPDAPGDIKPAVEISIAKMNVSAPMIWSQSENEKDMLAELKDGVAHFFKTAAPGQNGNMIISGHSSNYIWAKGDYNHIFKDLNNLEKGDQIVINTYQKNGRNISYRYVVAEKFITTPDDEKIFAETGKPVLTLSTCWPLGTNFRRLIVKAELQK